MKLCKDCAHCVIDPDWAKRNDTNNSIRFSRCRRTLDKNSKSRHVGYDPGLDDMLFCSTERIGGWIETLLFGSCGKKGRHFEPKP